MQIIKQQWKYPMAKRKTPCPTDQGSLQAIEAYCSIIPLEADQKHLCKKNK